VGNWDAQMGYQNLVIPLASRLAKKLPSSAKEAQALKNEALAFLSQAIDEVFPSTLIARPVEFETATLIEIALRLCRELDRLPTMQEVKKSSPWWNGLSKSTWHLRFEKAGLQGLKQSR